MGYASSRRVGMSSAKLDLFKTAGSGSNLYWPIEFLAGDFLPHICN